MSECDQCGLPETHCHCYFYELEERISYLEENLMDLKEHVNEIKQLIDKNDRSNQVP